MGKKMSKGEKLDLILSEIAKIRDALEALGMVPAARASRGGKAVRRRGKVNRFPFLKPVA